ncbi:MAG: DMT family transporter [Pseudomonadota bacterium]
MPLVTSPRRVESDNAPVGITAMLISMFLFSIMDALVKWLGGIYDTHQIMFFRCTVAMVPVLVFLSMRGGIGLLITQHPGLHLIRAVLGVSAMASAFYGFSLMRLADAISIMHTTPLFMTVLSVLVLGERVGIRRWSAVLIGFIGMLIVVRPGEGVLESGSAYMLIAALCIATITIIIRFLSATDDPVSITFYFTLAGIVVSTVACMVWGWKTPTLQDTLLLASVGLLGGLAQFSMTFSYRYAEVGLVAPLKYLSIAVGGTIGYLVWREIPDAQSGVGIALIVATGLYTLHRETRLAKLQSSKEQT